MESAQRWLGGDTGLPGPHVKESGLGAGRAVPDTTSNTEGGQTQDRGPGWGTRVGESV